MKSKEEIWKAYTASWSEADHEKRASVLKEIMIDNCLYQDPNTEINGVSQLSTFMAAFQKSVPGGYFVLKDFKSHHDKSMAQWALLNAAGQKIQDGVSYGLYKESRLLQMTGFFF